MLRDAEEEVIGHLAVVLEHGDAACPIERAHAVAGDELNATLDKGGEQRAGRIW